MISFEDFKKIELRVGKVIEAERVEKSEKLLKLDVDIGEKNEEGGIKLRQILAGIGKTYGPEDILGSEIIVVANLEPRSLMGLESQGMLLAASDDTGIILLRPDREAVPGSGIK